MLNLSSTTEISFDFGDPSIVMGSSGDFSMAKQGGEPNDMIPYSYQRILNSNESLVFAMDSKLNHFASNNIDSVLTETENKQSLYFYVIGLGGIVMFSIGMVTNILNLIILTQKSMKSTTNRYLCALSICDIFVLIFSLISLSNSFMNDYSVASDSLLSVNLGPSQLDALVTGPVQHFALTTTVPVHSVSASLPIASPFLTSAILTTTSPLGANIESQTTAQFSVNRILKAIKMGLSNLYVKWSVSIYPRLFPYTYPVAIMFQVACVWINLGMTCDRFIAIHFPLKSLKFCTTQNAKRVIACIFIFSLAYAMPRFFEYRVIVDKYSVNNETYEFVSHSFTEIGRNKYYRNIVYVWMYILLQSVLPLIILTIINVVLIMSLKESSKIVHVLRTQSIKKKRSKQVSRDACQSANSSQVDSEERRLRIWNKEVKRKDITIMLITVVVLFIVLQLPAVFCNCIYGITNYKLNTYPGSKLISNSDSAVCNVGNLFIITCSATNFFTYCIFNKRFRRELHLLLLRCMCFGKITKPSSFSRTITTFNSMGGMSSRTSYFPGGLSNRRKTTASKCSTDTNCNSKFATRTSEVNDSRKSSHEKNQNSSLRQTRGQTSVTFSPNVIDLVQAKNLAELEPPTAAAAADSNKLTQDEAVASPSKVKKQRTLAREESVFESDSEVPSIKRVYQSEPTSLLTKALFKKLSLVNETTRNAQPSPMPLAEKVKMIDPYPRRKAPLASSVTIDSTEDFRMDFV